MPLDQAAAEASRQVPGHSEMAIDRQQHCRLAQENIAARGRLTCAAEPSSALATRPSRCRPRAATGWEASAEAARAAPGIEPGTSRTRSENHATRPSSHLPLVRSSHSRTNPSQQGGRQPETTTAAAEAKGRAHYHLQAPPWAGNASYLPVRTLVDEGPHERPLKAQQGQPTRGLIAQLVRAYG